MRRPILGVLAVLSVSGVARAAMTASESLAATPEGSNSPRLDVVFCVDTTGSMSDEIEVVKRKMREIVANVAAGEPKPDVRFGLVIYRDRGDEYVTKRYPLTRDIDQVVGWINDMVANGGHDYPESVNEALHVAVNEMEWDPAPDVGRLIFLIGDAPPHLDYEKDYDYREESRRALERGITIDTIGCSGLKEKDQPVFEEIAGLALGTFELLTYMREYAQADGKREVVVTAGGSAYALGSGAKGDAWREGATRLAERGLVAKLSDEDARKHALAGGDPGAAFKGDRSMTDYEFGVALSRLGEPAAKPAEAAAAGIIIGYPTVATAPGTPTPAGARGGSEDRAAHVVASENNLDTLLTRQVQAQLARQGVRFADKPYLPRQEWRGGTCAESVRRAIVARHEGEWKAVWALVAEAEGAAEAPPVDFSRDMVLAVFGGAKWGGRTVRVEDVWERDDGLHVQVGRGPDDPKSTAPYHIIVVARYAGEVIWK